jgi:ribosome-associated protein
MTLEEIELARLILDIISDVKGENIVLIDIHEVTEIADYFIICSAGSDRQLRAIIDRVSQHVREQTGISALRQEGKAEGGWVLIDYGGVVVHAFTPEMRAYYDLEGFWAAAKTVVRMQ